MLPSTLCAARAGDKKGQERAPSSFTLPYFCSKLYSHTVYSVRCSPEINVIHQMKIVISKANRLKTPQKLMYERKKQYLQTVKISKFSLCSVFFFGRKGFLLTTVLVRWTTARLHMLLYHALVRSSIGRWRHHRHIHVRISTVTVHHLQTRQS